jgi:hypothetical protein
MRSMRALALAVLPSLAVVVGCNSTITGNEGNFQFSYPADDRVADFNKPLAVGAFLDLEVRDVGHLQPVTLSAASFDDTSVLDVVTFQGHEITITGVGEGSALLSVEGTTTDGETLTDSVNMLAAVPEVLILRHTCGEDEASAAYLTSQRIWMPFEMTLSNSQPVIGYGYYPVALPGDAPMTLSEADSGQQYMAFDTASAGGAFTLSSTIDDTTLEVAVVSPAELDGVAEPVAWVLEDIDVGDVNPFYALPTAAGRMVCQADTNKTVASLTPTICDVRDYQPAAVTGDEGFEYGWFEIEGLAEGTCEYTVTYTEGSGGAGATGTFTYPIQP